MIPSRLKFQLVGVGAYVGGLGSLALYFHSAVLLIGPAFVLGVFVGHIHTMVKWVRVLSDKLLVPRLHPADLRQVPDVWAERVSRAPLN